MLCLFYFIFFPLIFKSISISKLPLVDLFFFFKDMDKLNKIFNQPKKKKKKKQEAGIKHFVEWVPLTKSQRDVHSPVFTLKSIKVK